MASLATNLEKLKSFRDTNERKSREVVDIWTSCLSHNIPKLRTDKHVVLEQVCIAALDCYQMGIAQRCIEELYNDFPNSLRVKKYESMFLEAEEDYDKATEILNEIIKQDPTNSEARKRKIAILRAQGQTFDAIKELTEYLKVFMGDVEAWQELSELYISEHDYNKAAFCLEELILHSPHNHLFHQRYADIKYTQGGTDNLELARSYYCQAIKLNPNNMRALYGLYLATTAITTSPKSASQKKKEASKLLEWVSAEIQDRYKNVDLVSIEERLSALQISC